MRLSLLATRIAASIGTTVLLATLAIPAGAVEPFRFRDTQTISSNIECPGGVILTGTVTFNDLGIVFRDAEGFSTRLIFHSSIDQSYIGPTGIIASGTNVQNQTLDLDTRATSIRGVLINLRVAGVGIVAHASGQLKFDPAGNITFTPHALPDISGVCAALQ
jgi:hypothetical protein